MNINNDYECTNLNVNTPIKDLVLNCKALELLQCEIPEVFENPSFIEGNMSLNELSLELKNVLTYDVIGMLQYKLYQIKK